MASNIITVATAATAWALGLIVSLPDRLQRPFMRNAGIATTHELASNLSSQAKIHFPGSEGFELATDRWITWKNPHLEIVVEVTTEDDVANTVRYANANDKPFIAISGQHGANSALADIKKGVGVWMRSMKDVKIAEDGRSATFGGGIKAKEVVRSLWENGKMTVVGCCECTGAAATMLGGGHGWLQGRYGLMVDNLISARAVLGNGTTITISDDEHSDLFWGLRGAGHNFAILTSFESRIYDRTAETDDWAVDTMIFTADKFNGVHDQANRLIRDNQPVELIQMILWARIPDIDHDRPVILSVLVYQGKEIPKAHIGPFLKLEPVVHDSIVTDLPGLAPALKWSDSDPACQHGSTLLRFPVNLESYNLDGLRRAFAIFSNFSAPYKGSMMALEAYSAQGVQAVAEETTAYPDRKNKLLLSPFIWYNSDESLDDKAAEYGRQIRDALVNASGKPLHAYVNYAYGDESHEALYGYESWRVEKLRTLKEVYDPRGRFRYYNPI